MTSAHILVVDDDESVRVVTHEMLLRLGYSVTDAENGTDALAAMGEQEFDLVLLDLGMPYMTGEEVYAEMQERNLTTPVVFMTGVASDEARQIAERSADTIGILSKPFPMRKLESTLEEILAT